VTINNIDCIVSATSLTRIVCSINRRDVTKLPGLTLLPVVVKMQNVSSKPFYGITYIGRYSSSSSSSSSTGGVKHEDGEVSSISEEWMIVIVIVSIIVILLSLILCICIWVRHRQHQHSTLFHQREVGMNVLRNRGRGGRGGGAELRAPLVAHDGPYVPLAAQYLQSLQQEQEQQQRSQPAYTPVALPAGFVIDYHPVA